MKMVPAPPPLTSSPIMSSAHQQFQVTEDTPVDFLEGCMEILVVFPNEKSILMSIQRRMPMLDLLIHVTAANKISPAAHLLQVTDEEGRLLPHKPSTPIGSLNAHKVYIVAKNRLMADRSDSRSSNAKSSASQFEQSFRVQVRLPHNQLFVTRVTGRTQLADLLHTVCNEKALDPRHYELRHPVNLDERLRLNSCLDDYKLQEVVLAPLLGGRNATLLTPSVSVSDLSSTSESNSMNRKSANLTASNSSKMTSKSTLKSTTSEATLVGEKKKRGLLGLLGFGKHKKGSSMGDSSISSDSTGDRSISPARSEEPVPPVPAVEPVTPNPPSPVLFSKRLAEEAVAKRNSRLMLSQMSSETSTTPTSTNGPPPLRKTISTTSNGTAAPANKPVAKKKRAPAPPPPQPQPPPSTQLNGLHGPPKAASEVSSYSTSSSSGSNYVSPMTSVIHHSEEEVVLRSPSPKLSHQRQDSNYMSRQRQPDSGCSSPVRSPISNMITTPGNSSSNLTQVSSTSNASLASAIKKRKAPVPPPALHEHVEASENAPPPPSIVVIVDGSHDDSDRVSSVSDQLSSVSDLSSTRKSETPEIIEPAIVVELTPKHYDRLKTSVVTPVPAARTSIPHPVKSATFSTATNEGQVVNSMAKVLRDHRETSSNPKLSSSSYCSSSSESDDLALDDQCLDMFSSRNEDKQTADAQRAVPLVVLVEDAVGKRREQLQARSIQTTETERLKLAEQRQKLEHENLARQNGAVLMEQSTESPPEMERTKRKKWDRSAQTPLDRLAIRTGSSDDEMTLKIPVPPVRRPRFPSATAMSRTSSVSEFFSLSEAESDSPVQETMSREFREPEEHEDDPDASFAAMCAALARRKQRDDPVVPNDVDPVPIVTLASPDQIDCSSSSPSAGGDSINDGEFWQRPNIEQGWITEKSHSVSSPRSASPAQRRSSSLNDVPGDSFLFPLLSNSSFSAVLSSRGEYEDIPLLLINNEADGRLSYPDLDSSRSIATDSTNAISERPAHSICSEDDYEHLDYQRKNNAEKENNGIYNEAHQHEETVVAEPIYTMVIKSPKPHVAVDVRPGKDGKTEQSSQDVQLDEPDRCDVKAIVMLREEEPEMERDAGDGQTESPIMWEYKLPAPPTPFQDSVESPLDKLQLANESDSSRSTRSSMSTDSLQQNRSAVEENSVKDSPRLSIDSQESAAEISTEIFVKDDCHAQEVAFQLHHGLELLGETTTEEPTLDNPLNDEVVNMVEENKVILQSIDSEAKPYGIETTTDEPSSLPPIPSTLPPIDSDDDSLQSDMQFSITTYNVRVSKDSTYEKKLARSASSDELLNIIIEPTIDSPKEFNSPLPLVMETKEQEMVVDPVKAEEGSGNSPVAAASQLHLPMLNADFIQQFQNALHSITDPKARALQEEFLRLQQQFLTLQMQAVVQQSAAIPTESTSVNISTHHSDTTKSKEKTVVIDAPIVVDVIKVEPLVEADSKQSQLVESSVEHTLNITESAEQQLLTEEIELETPVYRYSGPPQVKLDTWKPGRPRSEVIDFSRSSSFNVPLAPVQNKIDPSVIGTAAATVLAMDSNISSPTVASTPEEVVVPIQVARIPEEESKIKPIVSEVEEILAVREKIGHIESSSSSSNCASPVMKPIVLRKSSFITARPFEARPVSMPIRRPNFTPMVIQPVPFVFGKIRAPEVRGFASLPPDNRIEMQGIRMVGPSGVVPFSAVNKNRSVAPVSKENPTIVIRNKLIESARRPSAELNGIPVKLEDSPDQDGTFAEVKECAPVTVETRRVSSFSRPLSMPMSSSLLLAAGAGGTVSKAQPLSPEISYQPITAQQSVISGADPATASARRTLSSKFVRKVDPREELLNSIRSFSNGGSLKKTGTNLNK